MPARNWMLATTVTERTLTQTQERKHEAYVA